jgi:hypothetical protein
MKFYIQIFFLFAFKMTFGQNIPSYEFFKVNSLTGRVVLKTLRSDITNKPIKNCLILELPKYVTFIPPKDTKEDECDCSEITTKEIHIVINHSLIYQGSKYNKLIGKNVTIKAKIDYAPSGHYPLLVNILDDFEYKILQ